MSLTASLIILFLAAFLEVGGDALVRKGLHAPVASSKFTFFVLSTLVFFAYGYTVNSPPWDFGRLLGVYVVCFFIASQVVAYFFFQTVPNRSVLIGGFFIVVGGAIMSSGKF